MARHLHLDPFAGVAGDMFIGCLIDLGAPLEAIDAALAPLAIAPPVRLTAESTLRHGIRGIDFKVREEEARSEKRGVTGHTHEHQHHGHGHHHAHEHGPHVRPSDILAMVDRLNVADRAKARARAVVTRLAEAEAAVHGKPVEEIHFHEVGATDSIVDMLGSAVALELLDIATISCAALPLGHGFVDCAHGRMPLPAPATAAILTGVPTYGVDRQGETVTPTGAALVVALTDTFGPLPAMNVEAIGYGAGDRDDPDTPNLLRAYLGERIA